MARKIITEDIHAALQDFVRARLACVSLPPQTVNRRKRFGKRQRSLIGAVIEEFCPSFVPSAVVVYIADAEDKCLHLNVDCMQGLGIVIPAGAKMPDVVVHDTKRNWLLLIEAMTSAGPVDGKRRKELKDLFAGCKAGLVFVAAFENRRIMQSFIGQIAWESEVWIAEDPDHMIHFNGERFLGPYPDVQPK